MFINKILHNIVRIIERCINLSKRALFYGLNTTQTIINVLIIIILVITFTNIIVENKEIEKQYTHADLLAYNTKEIILQSEDIVEIQEGIRLIEKLKKDYNTKIRLDDEENANITKKIYNMKTGVPWDEEAFFWQSNTAKALEILRNTDKEGI